MTVERFRRYFYSGLAALVVMAGALAQQPAKARVLGTVSAVSGNTVTVKTDTDGTVAVDVPTTARILKTEPGQKTLAGATAVTVSDIAPGDRVLMLVAGTPPTASIVVVNKASDLAALREKEREDWQRNGVGGLVTAVDPAAGTVTMTSGAKTIVVHTTGATLFRRYAQDSVKFSDAKLSTLAAIRPGDQLQARGQKSPDGSSIMAKEVVSGAFRNVAGTVVSTNAQAGTFLVKNWMNKKTLTIRTTQDTDMRRLPPQMAEMIAMRLRFQKMEGGHGPAAWQKQGKEGPPAGAKEKWHGPGGAPGGHPWGPPPGAQGQGGGLTQLLEHSPEIHVADLHKGDAVMIVATEGSPDAATAIRVVTGVESMLEASAKESQTMFSSAWSLGGGAGGSGGGQGGGGDGQGGEGGQGAP